MRVIGVREPGGEEERALKKLADDTADRKVNLIALPFDENRDELFEKIGRANISLMLSWHEGFGLTGWEAIAGEVPLIVSAKLVFGSFLRRHLESELPVRTCGRSTSVDKKETTTSPISARMMTLASGIASSIVLQIFVTRRS